MFTSRSTLLALALAVPLLTACPAPPPADHAPGDTAALRMERDGAVPEKTLPDAEVDTTLLTPPGVPQGARPATP